MLTNRPSDPPNRHQPQAVRTDGPLELVQQPADSKPITLSLPRGAVGWVFVIIAFMALEQFAPNNFKPSTLTGGFFGHEEAVSMRAKLEATQATIAAQNQENARMQQEIENFRARAERVTEAYKTLYQRSLIMSQNMAAIQQQYLKTRQEIAAKAEEGNIGIANTADMLSALGLLLGNKEMTEKSHAVGQAFREQSVHNYDKAMQSGLNNNNVDFSNWQSGLPDATDIVNEDRIAPMQPEPRKAPPPLPDRYQNPAPAQTQTASAGAASYRLARINDIYPKVFVRSEPDTSDTGKLCVLPQGAVVAVFTGSQNKALSPDQKVSFAHVIFNWQDHGATEGWISEKLLENFNGNANDAEAAQDCELPT